MRFEWDQAKNDANMRKHGVTFDEATGIFSDPDLDEFDMTEDDDGEERWRAFGRVDRARLDVLMVVYTDRRPDVRRVISARRATPGETDAYHSRFDRTR